MTVQCRGAPTSEPADERDWVDADRDLVGDRIADETKIVPRDGIVRKCATAIHMSGNIKLSQRRALNLLLYMALPHMPQRTRHQVSLNALAWAMTGDSRASRNLRTIIPDIKAMMQILVEWDVLGEDGGVDEWEGMTIVSWVRINRADDIVDYSFTPEFQVRVQNNARVAEIALKRQLAFRSIHALALYEHTRYYLEDKSTPWTSIASLMAIMGLSKNKYYQDFRRMSEKIIKPAVSSINETSDIEIAMEVQRKDKGEVVGVRFAVARKVSIDDGANVIMDADRLRASGPADAVNDGDHPTAVMAVRQQEVEDQNSPNDNLAVRLRLAEYAVPEPRALDLMRKHSAATILSALVAADNWLADLKAQGRPVRSKAAVAYKAIAEKWVGVARTMVNLPEKAEPVNAPTPARPPKTPRDRNNVWCVQYLDRLSAEDRQTTLAAFVVYLGDPQRTIIRAAYRSHGLESRAVLAELQAYLGSIGVTAPSAAR
ncbi:replication initiation protein [uncultured Thiodictyon sp.]|uniref:replication initiation protein n=1 Tax=uncultured Thiodictyon sp. TaxID=1846217 RepID=UPI0025DDCC3B|nr:replication initiation protein [uncultured Thiodictyon sp.]